MARYVFRLAPYSLDIQYRAGTLNTADAISRRLDYIMGDVPFYDVLPVLLEALSLNTDTSSMETRDFEGVVARVEALAVPVFINAIKSYKARIPIGFSELRYLISLSFIDNIVIIRLNTIYTRASTKLSRTTRRSPVKPSRTNILDLVDD